MDKRTVYDSIGMVEVENGKIWGAATQRSLENFSIGTETMPLELIRALAELKIASAKTHEKLDLLPGTVCHAIVQAGEEVCSGKWDDQFPLHVWQTGSGTQTNMNVNEVLAYRATELLQNEIRIHPNDHVNKSQSSNDVFPSAIHVSAAELIHNKLFPAIQLLIESLNALEEKFPNVIKIGRTHLQDATPIRFDQEISGWKALCEQGKEMILSAMPFLYQIPIGGTAVGTGINAPENFGELCVQELQKLTGLPFVCQKNKFAGLSGKDGIVFVHGALKALAANIWKIANDIRLLASGPRCGLGEITIPANEPGSSIMPGKVNPTQCESVTMVCAQVMGNDAAIGMEASQGNFQLNVFMPAIGYQMLQSIRLLSDSIKSFAEKCVIGITPIEKKMGENVQRSLMLITALNPIIGYDNGAKVVKKAVADGCTLKEAAIALDLLSAEEFDRLVDPKKMV